MISEMKLTFFEKRVSDYSITSINHPSTSDITAQRTSNNVDISWPAIPTNIDQNRPELGQNFEQIGLAQANPTPMTAVTYVRLHCGGSLICK